MIGVDAPVVLRPETHVGLMLRKLADALEGDADAELVVVVVSRRSEPRPVQYLFGRDARTAEVAGLLMQAAVDRDG